jgi:hypothetical protein
MGRIYTEELLREAVAASTSFAGVLRHLGLRQAGGTQAHIARRIRHFGIDTSHFSAKLTPAEPLAAADSDRTKCSSFVRPAHCASKPRSCAACSWRSDARTSASAADSIPARYP